MFGLRMLHDITALNFFTWYAHAALILGPVLGQASRERASGREAVKEGWDT